MAVTVRRAWKCRACEASGSGARADSEAEKHTKKTSHATLSWAEPEKEKA